MVVVMKRGMRRQSHCKNGHDWLEHGKLVMRRGKTTTICRACKAAQAAAYKAKNPEKIREWANAYNGRRDSCGGRPIAWLKRRLEQAENLAERLRKEIQQKAP